MTLIPIGQFSRVSRLSVKSLRNYHESGLLTPALVDPQSGYRYYRLSQLPRADAIRSLRIVGMPLAQVGEMLDGDDPEQVLTSHLTSLSAQLDDLHRKSLLVRRLLDRQEYAVPHEVTVKSLPAQSAAVHRTTTTMADIFDDIPAGFGHVLAGLSVQGIEPAGVPFTVLHQPPDADTPGDIAMCVPVATDGVDASTLVDIPAAVVAALVHHGPYDDMGRSYAAVAAWVHERGHRLVGPTREVYLNSPDDVAEADLATELLFPIDADPESGGESR